MQKLGLTYSLARCNGNILSFPFFSFFGLRVLGMVGLGTTMLGLMRDKLGQEFGPTIGAGFHMGASYRHSCHMTFLDV